MKPVVVMTGVAVGWIVFSAAAETNYWIATSGTGNWNEPANWSLDRVPGAEDTVIITNAATTGNGYTVEIDQAPVNVFRVTCSAPGGQMLTLNVRTNLTVNNNSSSDADWSFGPKGNVAINIHSNAELDAYCQILGAGESNNYTVLPGGTLRYGRTPSKRFRVYGSLTVQGSVIAGNRAGELIYANPLILDGGYLFAKALSSPPELVTNNASLSYSLMRIAGMTVTMRDGTVTNRADDALHIGNAASGNASAFLNLSGGALAAGGARLHLRAAERVSGSVRYGPIRLHQQRVGGIQQHGHPTVPARLQRVRDGSFRQLLRDQFRRKCKAVSRQHHARLFDVRGRHFVGGSARVV